MPAEEHVPLPDGLFLLESLPSSMLALGIAYQSLPARESEADREHAGRSAMERSFAARWVRTETAVGWPSQLAAQPRTPPEGGPTCSRAPGIFAVDCRLISGGRNASTGTTRTPLSARGTRVIQLGRGHTI